MSGGTSTRRLRITLGISAVLLLCGLGAAGVPQSGWVHPADDVFPLRQMTDQPPARSSLARNRVPVTAVPAFQTDI